MLSLVALPNAVLFAITGLLVFGAAAVILFRTVLPNLWQRAAGQGDLGASIVVAALLLSIGFIVGSAVH